MHAHIGILDCFVIAEVTTGCRAPMVTAGIRV
jgi:hypothetical protein